MPRDLLADAAARYGSVYLQFQHPRAVGEHGYARDWYIDRSPTSGFVSPVVAPNGTPITLDESIAGADVQPGTSFYNTQGRDFDLPAGTTSVTIALYVPATWA